MDPHTVIRELGEILNREHHGIPADVSATEIPRAR
jgi:hypothetical protein